MGWASCATSASVRRVIYESEYRRSHGISGQTYMLRFLTNNSETLQMLRLGHFTTMPTGTFNRPVVNRGWTMRTFHRMVLVTMTLFVGSVAVAQQSGNSSSAAKTPRKPATRTAVNPAGAKAVVPKTSAKVSTARPLPEATFKELMDSIVDPASDVIWDAVSTSLTDKGYIEKRPT